MTMAIAALRRNRKSFEFGYSGLQIETTMGYKPGEFAYITEMVESDLYCTGLPLAVELFGYQNLLHVQRDSTSIYNSSWGKYIAAHRNYVSPAEHICPEFYVPHPRRKKEALECFKSYMEEHAEACFEDNLFETSPDAAVKSFGEGNFIEVEFAGEIYVPHPIYLEAAMRVYSAK